MRGRRKRSAEALAGARGSVESSGRRFNQWTLIVSRMAFSPARMSFNLLCGILHERSPRCFDYKRVQSRTDFIDDSVPRTGHILCRVPGNVFPQGIAIELAPRFVGIPRQTLRCIENVVGNRNYRFHTSSITESANHPMPATLLQSLTR